MNIQQRFDRAVEYLYKTNHYLAAEVTKLGYPEVVVGYPPTAGVLWDKERKKIRFLFNEKFAEIIDDVEFAFVLGHECRHVVNGHVFLLKTEIDRMTRSNKTPEEISAFKNKFNRAADCVVNDSLVYLDKLPKVLEERTATKPKIIYGIPTVGVECYDSTVMDVYYLLPEPQEGDEVDNHLWDSFFDSSGSIDQDFVDTIKDFIEHNMENSALSDPERKKVDELKKELKDSSDYNARQAGKSAESSLMPIDRMGSRTLNWGKILYQFVDSQKTHDIWSRPNKKLISVYPNLIAPSWGYADVQDIFIAIDVSGSISKDALKIFSDVVRNTPKNIRVKAITFNTGCEPYNIRFQNIRSGGGTSFEIIESYIQQNLKKYPKAVFVLTDGEGDWVRPKFPARWCWILYGNATETYCKGMKTYNISDLLK